MVLLEFSMAPAAQGESRVPTSLARSTSSTKVGYLINSPRWEPFSKVSGPP